MRGEIADYKESLRRRVALLKGVPATALQRVYDERLRLNPGAERARRRAASAAGLKTLLVSGGFTFFTDRVRDRLGIDFTRSNVLEIADGALTGRWSTSPGATSATAPRRSKMLLETCAALGIAPAQAIAVGDGANDLPMMAAAGLRSRTTPSRWCAQQAMVAIDDGGLDRLLEVVAPEGRRRSAGLTASGNLARASAAAAPTRPFRESRCSSWSTCRPGASARTIRDAVIEAIAEERGCAAEPRSTCSRRRSSRLTGARRDAACVDVLTAAASEPTKDGRAIWQARAESLKATRLRRRARSRTWARVWPPARVLLLHLLRAEGAACRRRCAVRARSRTSLRSRCCPATAASAWPVAYPRTQPRVREAIAWRFAAASAAGRAMRCRARSPRRSTMACRRRRTTAARSPEVGRLGAAATRLATCSPIASDAVSPGDSMPNSLHDARARRARPDPRCRKSRGGGAGTRAASAACRCRPAAARRRRGPASSAGWRR